MDYTVVNMDYTVVNIDDVFLNNDPIEPIINKVLIEYDKSHIDIINNKKSIYIDMITCPLEEDLKINISGIKNEDNVFDINKYFILRSCIDKNIIITYSIIDNETNIYKISSDLKIYQYIFIFDALFFICKDELDNVSNMIIYVENNTYYYNDNKNEVFNDLFENINTPDQISNLIVSKKDINHIEKSEINLVNDECSNDDIIKMKIEKYKSKNIHLQMKNKNIHLSEIGNSILYIDNMIYNLTEDIKIIDIFKISLDHILLLSYNNIMYFINFNSNSKYYMELLEFNLSELIVYLNNVFYNNIKNKNILFNKI